MKARQLIANATYRPDQLKVIGQAFDDAWDQISPRVSRRPLAIEAVRLKLAQVVLILPKNGTQDPQALTDAAVRVMLSDPIDLQGPV